MNFKKKILNNSIVLKILDYYLEIKIKILFKKKIINFLENNSHNLDKEEVKNILKFIKKNSVHVFPYKFINYYKSKDITVYHDQKCDMKYVLHENKKLYFPRYLKNSEIQKYYNDLLIEQDSESPHLYEISTFHVRKGDIIADVGAAEGIFALNNIEKVKKAYIFECESYWIEALKKTFEPYKDKVIIVNKYISNITQEKNISIDDFFKNKNVDFIKADIEGAEISLIDGGQKTLTKNDLKIILCTYHKKNDEKIINEKLINKGFETEFSKGYMIFFHDPEFSAPYLRKGLIRAKN